MRPLLIVFPLLLFAFCSCAPGNEKSSTPVYKDASTSTATNRDSTLSFQCIGLSEEGHHDDDRRPSSGHGRPPLAKLTTWQTVDIHNRLSEIERRIGDLEEQIEPSSSSAQDKSKRS